MSLESEVNELKALEEKIFEKVKAINEALEAEIKSKPLEDVNLCEDSVLCATVSSQAIFSTPTHIFEPSYYLPECQANAVKERLSGCKSIQSTCNAVKQMLEDRSVRIGNTTTRLNEFSTAASILFL